jgi:hypothetical protein
MLARIGDKIGADIMSETYFMYDRQKFENAKYITVDNNDRDRVWLIVDEFFSKGKNAENRARGDCGALSLLMKKIIELLGDDSAKVAFVYPRHKSWEGLANTSYRAVEFSPDNNPKNYLGYVYGGWNNFEGCCVFQDRWWMGGLGMARNNPYNVLMRVTKNNKDQGYVSTTDNTNSDNGRRQCWFVNLNKSVSYPIGMPTDQQLEIKQNNN